MNILLWIIQVLLALLFLLAGSTKFLMTVEQMNSQAPVKLPGLFIHFIGACEILGALGLILPMLLRIKPRLTPLAACGLAIITLGATVVTLMGGVIAPALFPFVVAMLCLFVAYQRRGVS